MRYTETISIPWHTLNGEKPCPNRDIVVKRSGANTLYAPKDIVHAADVPQALTKYDRYDEWAYVDEIKTVHSDGKILPDTDDLLTKDNADHFIVFAVSCYVFDYEEPYERVYAEIVLKDGTKIPFDVPVFKDPKTICHAHSFLYKGNRYIIDIMPNDNRSRKEPFRASIHRSNGPEHAVIYGHVIVHD